LINFTDRPRNVFWLMLILGLVFGTVTTLAEVEGRPLQRPLKLSPTRTLTAILTATGKATAMPSPSVTQPPTSPPSTPTPSAPSPTASATVATTVATPTPTPSTTIAPYPGAPLCADSGAFGHNHDLYHALWDDGRGCHYDHEHGQAPFTSEVSEAFPGLNLYALLGNVEVGHTNPSSPMENTHKHGGFKWNVQLVHPQTCAGFEGAQIGVNGSAIQFHGFGDYAIEVEVRIHSTVALLRQCSVSDPTDYGYMFVNQLQDYGQRITPYQGTILPYPNQPFPAFASPRGPYLSFDCLDLTEPHVAQCRDSFEQALANAANSNWASKVTGEGHSDAPALFRLLWRVRDTYRLFDWNDQTYPFTFLWLCSMDGGATYAPNGCEYNNSTTQVHEIAGEIPTAWDNLAGWDSDSRVGRITAEGFVDGAGEINAACSAAGGPDCYPIKLVQAFTGTYGSVLVFTDGKGTNVVPITPERDTYFCGTQVCAEADPGAVSAGWIGPEN